MGQTGHGRLLPYVGSVRRMVDDPRRCGCGAGRSMLNMARMTRWRLRFVTLTEADAQMVATWFANDPEGQREFGGFFGVHPKWWNLVQKEPGRYGWTVWHES